MFECLENGGRLFFEDIGHCSADNNQRASYKRAPTQLLIESEIENERVIDDGDIGKRRKKRGCPVSIGDSQEDLTDRCGSADADCPPQYLGMQNLAIKNQNFRPTAV